MRRIVVGVDDSPGGAAALRWAVQEARLRGVTLLVMHAWDWPYRGHLGELADEALDTSEFDAAAQVVLKTLVDQALEDGADDVSIEQRVSEGSAAKVLIEAAVDAELLVVGARGRGGFEGLLLGSVSSKCAHHAPCPVVIVPTPAGRPQRHGVEA